MADAGNMTADASKGVVPLFRARFGGNNVRFLVCAVKYTNLLSQLPRI